MATREELESAVVAAAKAGDMERGRILAAALSQYKDPTTIDTAKSYGASALGGLLDPVDALAQLAPRVGSAATSGLGIYPNSVSKWFDAQAGEVDQVVKGRESAIQDYRQKAGRDGFDAVRMGANIVNPVNALPAAAVAGKIGQAGQTTWQLAKAGGKAGLLSAALQPVANTDDFWKEKGKQGAVGLVAGGLLTPAIVKIGEPVAKRVNAFIVGAKNRLVQPDSGRILMDALEEAGLKADDFSAQQLAAVQDDISKALKGGKVIDPAAIFRKADFDALDMRGTAGQIGRDPMQYTRERNLSNVEDVGGPLQARFMEQDRRLAELLNSKAAGATEPVIAGNQLVGRLKSVDDQMSERVSGLYKAARESADAAATVPTTGLAQDLGVITRNYQNSIPEGLLNRFRDYGFLDGKQTKIFDMFEADQLLKSVNEYGDVTNKSTESALTALRSALKKAITESPGPGDPFSTARRAAHERFKLQDVVPALKAVSEGNVSPDKFVSKFITNADVSDVKGMAKLLDPDSMDQVRAQIGERLRNAAYRTDVVGDKAFAADSFNTELKRIGESKLSAFFSADEISQLKRIGRVAAYKSTVPANSGVNYSNTASAARNAAKALGSGVMDTPFLSMLPSAVKKLRDANTVSYGLEAGVDPLIPLLSQTGQARLGLLGLAGPLGAGATLGDVMRMEVNGVRKD